MFSKANQTKIGSIRLGALMVSSALLAGFGFVSESKAEMISISGAGFMQQCPCSASGNLPDVKQGVLMPTDVSTLYAPVDFPFNGQRICSLSIVYQDINANDTMTARLLRKPVSVGADPFLNPKVIAKVSTAAGVVNTERKETTTKISLPVINDLTGFYYVEVASPTINMNLVGVQIQYDRACQ